MKSRKGLDGEDLRLWRQAVAKTKPLPLKRLPETAEAAEAPREPAKPHPSPPQRFGGIEGTVLRRLRRGSIAIEARLDLHGLHQRAAHTELDRFLSQAQARGVRLVLIITGKGRSGEATLRRLVPLWLRAGDNRARVAMVREASPEHGGAGAFYVYLAAGAPR